MAIDIMNYFDHAETYDKVQEWLELPNKEEAVKNITSDSFAMAFSIKSQKNLNFYELCPEEMKKNYSFVRCILNLAKEMKLTNEDKKLVCKIIQNYLEDKNLQVAKKQVFSICAEAIQVIEKGYPIHTVCNDVCIREYENAIRKLEIRRKEQKELGRPIALGFNYIRIKYNHYENIIDMFARMFIIKIFSRSNYSLELELREEFSTPDQARDFGINNYLLNYIKRCDLYLYEYLAKKPELLSDVHDKMDGYLKKWSTSINQRYYTLFEEIHEYIAESYGFDSKLGELEIIAYIANELKLPESIFLFDSCGCIIDRQVMRKINFEYIGSIINKSFPDRRKYEDIKEIFVDVLHLKEEEVLTKRNPTFKSARNDLKFNDQITRTKIIHHDFRNDKTQK